MRLATRILFGYWYLVILIIIIAAGAALGVHGLGNNIGRVLAENVESVRASTQMIESLERQDSSVLAAMLGKAGARASLETSELAFRQALRRARANITIAEETPVIEEIDRSFTAFVLARDELLGTSPSEPLRAYDDVIFPSFERVKNEVLNLLEINHRAMMDADRQAQASASRQASTLGLVVLIALSSLAFLSRALNRTILERLDELSRVAEAIAGGSFDRRAADHHLDELGAVARQLNAALDRQQEARMEIESRVAMYRNLVVGLLRDLPGPVALFGLDGRILASTFGEGADSQLAALSEEIPGPESVRDPVGRDVVFENEAVNVTLLRGPSERPLGWLARAKPAAGR
jgi:HAMP domain-containing protein